MSLTVPAFATERQVAYLASLVARRVVPAEIAPLVTGDLSFLTRAEASKAIDALLAAPLAPAGVARAGVAEALSALPKSKYAVPAAHLAQLIDLAFDKTVSGNTAKSVLIEMFQSGRAPKEIVEAQGLGQISDEGILKEMVIKLIADNPKEVASYLGGKETLLQWFMGQVARATKGKADPQAVKQLLLDEFEKLKK